MPPIASLISDVGDLTIEGGSSFTMNVRQTTIRKGLAKHDLNKLCSVLDSANAKLTKNMEDHQNAVSSVVRRLQPGPPIIIDGSVQQTPVLVLLSRAQQLVALLPVAHLDLVRQFAGTFRPHTNTQRFGDNLVLVGAPLLSSSIFSTFSAEVQFMVFYFLIAMIFVDLYHPRLIYNTPSSRVSVLDALGKYHDFPWSACENLTTFHAEFRRRSLNQTGYSFVKSRLYEVEYNGCVMKPDDWPTVKPFTDLFVDFVLIQQGGLSQVVKCPWCRRENPLPSDSGFEESTTTCSCSGCGRDFSAAVGFVEDGGNHHTPSPALGKTVSVEIRRFRIRLQSRKKIFPAIAIDGPLPPGFVPHTITDANGISTPIRPMNNTWGYFPGDVIPGPLPHSAPSHEDDDICINIEPPDTPYIPSPNMSQGYLSPFTTPNVGGWPAARGVPLSNDNWAGYPLYNSDIPGAHPFPNTPDAHTPPPPSHSNSPWYGRAPLAYRSPPASSARWATPSSTQTTSSGTESNASRKRLKQLHDLLEISPLNTGSTPEMDDATTLPDSKLACPTVVELYPDDTQLLESESGSPQGVNSSTNFIHDQGKYEQQLSQYSPGGELQSFKDDGMNMLGLSPIICQSLLNVGPGEALAKRHDVVVMEL